MRFKNKLKISITLDIETVKYFNELSRVSKFSRSTLINSILNQYKEDDTWTDINTKIKIKK